MFVKKLFNNAIEFFTSGTALVVGGVMLGYVLWEKNRTLEYADVYPNGAPAGVEEAFEHLDGKAIPIIINDGETIEGAISKLPIKYSALIGDKIIEQATANFIDAADRGATALANTGESRIHKLCIIQSSKSNLFEHKFTYYHELGHCVESFNSGKYALEYFPSSEEYSDALYNRFKNGNFTKAAADRVTHGSGYIYPREVFADIYAYYMISTKGLMTNKQFEREVMNVRAGVKGVYSIVYNTTPFLKAALNNPVKKGERFPDYYVRILEMSKGHIEDPTSFMVKVVTAVKQSELRK